MSLCHLDKYKLVKEIETIKCIDMELYMEESVVFVGNMKNKQIRKWKCKRTCMYTIGLMKVGIWVGMGDWFQLSALIIVYSMTPSMPMQHYIFLS